MVTYAFIRMKSNIFFFQPHLLYPKNLNLFLPVFPKVLYFKPYIFLRLTLNIFYDPYIRF